MTDDIKDIEEPEKSAEWLEMIQQAERYFDGWQAAAGRIERIYSSAERFMSSDREFGLFWANIQVMLPAIYARTPKPVVSPRFKDRRKLYTTASEMLERCCDVSFDKGEIDATMLSIRDDLAIIGRGVAWARYEDDDKKGERVCYEYVDRDDFTHDPARRWEAVQWVARRGWLTFQQMKKRFGLTAAQDASYSRKPGEDAGRTSATDHQQKAGVWEIWHKPTNSVVWVVDGCEDVLEKSKPHLKLERFFPCPKPAYATLESRTLIPVPDVRYYQDQLVQINELTARIAGLSRWLQYKGLYQAGGDIGDAVEQALGMQNPDTVLVPIANMASLSASGGAPVWMFPVDQLAATLTGCVDLRRQLIEDVYQIVGLSDIMRGQTQADETLGAQRIKQQNGSSRVRDKQNELERVARDLLRIGAEIMAEKFDRKTLEEMSQMDLPTNDDIKKQMKAAEDQAKQALGGIDDQAKEIAASEQPEEEKQKAMQELVQQQQEMVQQFEQQFTQISETVTIDQVMEFFKDEKTRPFALDIETDSTIFPDEAMEKAARAEFMQAFTGAMSLIPMAAQAGPKVVALAGEVFKFALAPYRVGRELEGMIDDMVADAPAMAERQAKQGGESDEMAKANLELARAEMVKAQAAVAKVEADTQAKMQQISLDAEKAKFEAQASQQKLGLEVGQTRATIDETDARTRKVEAEIQKMMIDASNQTRKEDREDTKLVADTVIKQEEQRRADVDQQRSIIDGERSNERAERGEMRADRQQDFTERSAQDD